MKARLSLVKTIMLGSLAFSFSTNAEVKTPVLELSQTLSVFTN